MAKVRVRKRTLQRFPGDSLQHIAGVVGEFPQYRIELAPYRVGAMVPAPADVQSQIDQHIESLNVGRQSTIQRMIAPQCAHAISIRSRISRGDQKNLDRECDLHFGYPLYS